MIVRKGLPVYTRYICIFSRLFVFSKHYILDKVQKPYILNVNFISMCLNLIFSDSLTEIITINSKYFAS